MGLAPANSTDEYSFWVRVLTTVKVMLMREMADPVAAAVVPVSLPGQLKDRYLHTRHTQNGDVDWAGWYISKTLASGCEAEFDKHNCCESLLVSPVCIRACHVYG